MGEKSSEDLPACFPTAAQISPALPGASQSSTLTRRQVDPKALHRFLAPYLFPQKRIGHGESSVPDSHATARDSERASARLLALRARRGSGREIERRSACLPTTAQISPASPGASQSSTLTRRQVDPKALHRFLAPYLFPQKRIGHGESSVPDSHATARDSERASARLLALRARRGSGGEIERRSAGLPTTVQISPALPGAHPSPTLNRRQADQKLWRTATPNTLGSSPATGAYLLSPVSNLALDLPSFL